MVSRAAALLRDRELGTVVGLKSDVRYRRFVINKKGRELINEVDWQIARQIVLEVKVVSEDSRRYWQFTQILCDLSALLPFTWVTRPKFESDVQFFEVVTPQERELLKPWIDLVAKRAKSAVTSRKRIVDEWDFFMMRRIDPEGWKEFRSQGREEKASSKPNNARRLPGDGL